eukprot:12202904-Ditylum_brightwellii.AAC.1
MISAAITFLTKARTAPVIRAYYAIVPSHYTISERKIWYNYQSILINLMITCSHLLLVVLEAEIELTPAELAKMMDRAQQNFVMQTQCINFKDNSDRIGEKVFLHTLVSKDLYAGEIWDFAIPSSPPVSSAFEEALYEPFNDVMYALQLNEELFTLQFRNKQNEKEPSVQAVIQFKGIENELGYQLYDARFPAPKPSSNT